MTGIGFIERERQNALGFDLAMAPGARDDRRGAERALLGMNIGIELDLTAAIRASAGAGDLELLGWKLTFDR